LRLLDLYGSVGRLEFPPVTNNTPTQM